MEGGEDQGHQKGCLHLFSRVRSPGAPAKPSRFVAAPDGQTLKSARCLPPSQAVCVESLPSSLLSSLGASHFSMMVPYCPLSPSSTQSALPTAFSGGHFLCAPSRLMICCGCFSNLPTVSQLKIRTFDKDSVPSLECSALESTPDWIWVSSPVLRTK